ncbi:hypothetical protein RCL1_006747 [Eukaryota sp. TZLM3-RCL]
MESALNILQHLPPSNINNSLDSVLDIAPHLAEDLLPLVDQPLTLENDSLSNRQFLCCDHNRDVDSFRSPFSNTYFPALEDGILPPDNLRLLEIQANEAFSVYQHLYYDNAYSSAYFFPDLTDETAFGACILFKKDVDPFGPLSLGSWDSIHVFKVTPKDGKDFLYELTSTIMLTLKTSSEKTGKLDLEGTLKRNLSQTVPVTAINTHIANMGKMLEETENRMRDELENVYFNRTRDMIAELHREAPEIKRDVMIADLRSKLLSRKLVE